MLAAIDLSEVNSNVVIIDQPLNSQSSLDDKLISIKDQYTNDGEIESTESDRGSVMYPGIEILNSEYPNAGNKAEKIVTFQESPNVRISEVNQSEADPSVNLPLSDTVHSEPHDITFSLHTQSESPSVRISAKVHESVSDLRESSSLSNSIDGESFNIAVNSHTPSQSPTMGISAEVHQSESNLFDRIQSLEKFDSEHFKILFSKKIANFIHKTQSELSCKSETQISPSSANNLTNIKKSPNFSNAISDAIRTRLNLLYDVSPNTPLKPLLANSSNSPSVISGNQFLTNTPSMGSTGLSLTDTFQMSGSEPVVLRRQKYHPSTHICPKLLKLEEKISEREVPPMCSKWVKSPTGTGVWKQVGPIRSDQVPCNQLAPGDYILEKNIDTSACSSRFSDYSLISEKVPVPDGTFLACTMSSEKKNSTKKNKGKGICQIEASKLGTIPQLQAGDTQHPNHIENSMSLHKLFTSNPLPQKSMVSTAILQEVSPSSRSCIVNVKGNKIRTVMECDNNSLSEVTSSSHLVPHVETKQKDAIVSERGSAKRILRAQLHASHEGCVKVSTIMLCINFADK